MKSEDLLIYFNQYLKDQYPKNILEKFIQFLMLIDKWNKVYNLTAIRDAKEMVIRHLLDSLSIQSYLEGDRIIDVGTGGGLPGIPLALIYPEKQFVLLDSNSKKTRFVTQAVIELQLNNVEVVHARVENYQPDICFDTVVSRAFASLKEMLEMTKHLVCEKGIFLAMKGVYPKEEIAEIKNNHQIKTVDQLTVPGLDAERHVIVVGMTTKVVNEIQDRI